MQLPRPLDQLTEAFVCLDDRVRRDVILEDAGEHAGSVHEFEVVSLVEVVRS
ncbi:MAG: hypothetical protein AAGI91_08970 [Bacteroidota bacterium]